MRSDRFALFRLACIVFCTVLLASSALALSQLYLRGHVQTRQDVLKVNLSEALHAKIHLKQEDYNAHEREHYEFFQILDQPLTVRSLPELNLPENPGLRFRQKSKAGGNPSPRSKYIVQLSNYKTLKEAQYIAGTLQAQGYTVAVSTIANQGQNPRYHVRIDGGQQRQDAEAMRHKLESHTGLKASIVSL